MSLRIFIQRAAVGIVCAMWAQSLALSLPGTDETSVEAHFRSAQQALKDGNPALAVKECQTVLRLDPTLVEARINLGLAYHLLGQYRLAVAELSQALRTQPKVLGANIVLGIDYLKLGRPENAIAPLKAALAIEPSNHEARHNLAAAYLAEKDYLHAGREFREVFLQEPDKEEAWFGLGHDYLSLSSQLTARIAMEFGDTPWQPRLTGNILEQRRLWNDAAREYRKALAMQPAQPGLHTRLGYALLHAAQPEQAENEFRAALRINSSDVEALLGLSAVHLSQGDVRGAQQNVESALEISPQYLNQVEDFPAIDIPPEVWRKMVVEFEKFSPKPAANFLLWAGYKALGERDQAEEERKSFQAQAAALASQRVKSPNANSGHQACQSHDDAACVKWLMSRKNLNPADDLTLGKSDLRLGQNEAGADALAAVLAAEPRNAEAVYWLERAYSALAENCFNQLMTQFPNSWRTHQLWAETYHLQHDDKEAIAEYQAAARLQPQDFELHQALGELYLDGNSLEEAQKELEETLALNPTDARGLYLMGGWYIAQRQPEKAIPYLERSVRFDPGLLEARAALGKAYLRTGQAALAVTELAKAIALDHYGDLHYMLYEAYNKLGKKDLAQAALAQSQELRRKSAAEDQAKIKRAESE